MFQVLHPTYTIKIEVKDGAPPAPVQMGAQLLQANSGIPTRKWYGMPDTGCDVLLAAVKKALSDAGISGAVVTLDKFEHRA